MAESRVKEILDEWRAVANAAPRPVEAPRPPRQVGSFGIATGAVAVVVVLVALLIRGGQQSGLPGSSALGSQSPAASLVADVASPIPQESASPRPTLVASPIPTESASPIPTGVASSAPLPNPGGTCSASQFVVGQATSQYETSVIVASHVGVRQPVQNTGADCVLELPKVIGFADQSGPFQAVVVPNMGQVTCKDTAAGRECKYVYPTSFQVKSGQTVTIEFNASWFNGNNPGFAPPPCAGTVSDVTRSEFPLASGSIEIVWDTALLEVCTSPSSVSVTVDN